MSFHEDEGLVGGHGVTGLFPCFLPRRQVGPSFSNDWYLNRVDASGLQAPLPLYVDALWLTRSILIPRVPGTRGVAASQIYAMSYHQALEATLPVVHLGRGDGAVRVCVSMPDTSTPEDLRMLYRMVEAACEYEVEVEIRISSQESIADAA